MCVCVLGGGGGGGGGRERDYILETRLHQKMMNSHMTLVFQERMMRLETPSCHTLCSKVVEGSDQLIAAMSMKAPSASIPCMATFSIDRKRAIPCR